MSYAAYHMPQLDCRTDQASPCTSRWWRFTRPCFGGAETFAACRAEQSERIGHAVWGFQTGPGNAFGTEGQRAERDRLIGAKHMPAILSRCLRQDINRRTSRGALLLWTPTQHRLQ